MSSTLTMMDFFPRRCLNDPPGGPGPLTCQAICATHNKVNIFVRRTNLRDLAPNSFGSRNGCLSFWKLRPPNLIRCLFAARTGFKKMFDYRLLAAIAIRFAVPEERRIRIRGVWTGNPAGRWA